MSLGLRLRLDGTAYDVRAVARAGGWDVAVGDRSLPVEHVATLAPPVRIADATVTQALLRIDGRLARTIVARTPARTLVAVGARTYVLVPDDGAAGAAAGPAGTGQVLAPMPGTVIEVLVAAGDHVEAGDPVLVIEAMKMETTLAADVTGTVAAVRAEVGATVEGDALLVEITPDA